MYFILFLYLLSPTLFQLNINYMYNVDTLECRILKNAVKKMHLSVINTLLYDIKCTMKFIFKLQIFIYKISH